METLIEKIKTSNNRFNDFVSTVVLCSSRGKWLSVYIQKDIKSNKITEYEHSYANKKMVAGTTKNMELGRLLFENNKTKLFTDLD
jgi:hypothetical protein